ncbi:MAG TPA: hypothetical protein PLK30_14260 [Blastocatellia bacterium]|nr:hypothetical protein [Blastocatellia bacterium]
MEEKILTRNPDAAKQGFNISKQKYDATRSAILASLANGTELTLKELFAAVSKHLNDELNSSIKWYATVVKLDLEARKVIERVPKAKPHRIRLR